MAVPGVPLFRYLPLSAGRELFLPSGPAAATAGGLALYSPINLGARGYRALMSACMRLGLAPALLASKPLDGSPSLRHLEEHGILRLLRDKLDGVAAFAVYQGKEAVVRKPTVLALDRQGRPLAYAKIGWNAATRDLVGREHEALNLLGRLQLGHGRVAPVLGYFDLGHSRILITAPLRHVSAAPEFRLTTLHAAFLQEVGEATLARATFQESDFLGRIKSRLQRLRAWMPAGQVAVLEAAVSALEREAGPEAMPWVLRLGDFLPWNFGVDRAANRIDLVDLEFAEQGSPVGWDLFHFLIGIGRQFAPLDLAQQARSERFRTYFRSFGVEAAFIPWLQLAYLVDFTIFFRHMWQGEVLTPGATRNTEIRLQAISRALAALEPASPGA
jgi:hypothetical protein